MRGRHVFSVAGIALGGWLFIKGLAGVHAYTIQGDRCAALLRRIRAGSLNVDWQVCPERQSAVYFAFWSEITIAVAFVVGAGLLWRRRRDKSCHVGAKRGNGSIGLVTEGAIRATIPESTKRRE